MQSLLCAGPIWGGIQQPSWSAQPIAAPVAAPLQPPTSMRVMFLVFRLQNLCWILMSELETYVLILLNLCWYCLCWELLKLCLYINVCVGYICLWWSVMYICDICEISFVCLDGIGKTNKKGVYWSLCRVSHSAKRYFAECLGHSTRQRTKT